MAHIYCVKCGTVNDVFLEKLPIVIGCRKCRKEINVGAAIEGAFLCVNREDPKQATIVVESSNQRAVRRAMPLIGNSYARRLWCMPTTVANLNQEKILGLVCDVFFEPESSGFHGDLYSREAAMSMYSWSDVNSPSIVVGSPIVLDKTSKKPPKRKAGRPAGSTAAKSSLRRGGNPRVRTKGNPPLKGA